MDDAVEALSKIDKVARAYYRAGSFVLFVICLRNGR